MTPLPSDPCQFCPTGTTAPATHHHTVREKAGRTGRTYTYTYRLCDKHYQPLKVWKLKQGIGA